MKKKIRKKKFVVWLSNKTDIRDDEWISVSAVSESEARELVLEHELYDDWRFSVGNAVPVSEFNKQMGISGLAGPVVKIES